MSGSRPGGSLLTPLRPALATDSTTGRAQTSPPSEGAHERQSAARPSRVVRRPRAALVAWGGGSDGSPGFGES